MKSLAKVFAVIVLLFIGNRIFNHVDAWVGIALMLGSLALAIYFIFKPIKNNGNDD